MESYSMMLINRNQFSKLVKQRQLKKWPLMSYSVRKVNQTTYNGPVMQVRRSSDNLLGDLYCDMYGFERALYITSTSTNITTRAAIKQWIRGSVIYLKTWYDQSGNAKNLQQTTATLQPTLRLFRAEGFPTIRCSFGSSIKLTLGINIRDFTILAYGDFSPQTDGQRYIYLEESTATTTYDNLMIGPSGLYTTSDGGSRTISTPMKTMNTDQQAVGWAQSDEY